MTRINTSYKPSDLTHNHLLAENKEIIRLPGMFKDRANKGNFKDIPGSYFDLHPKTKEIRLKSLFWLDKGKYTLNRYKQIRLELIRRGFKPSDYSFLWDIYKNYPEYFNDYTPTRFEINLLECRIIQRLLTVKY